MAKPLTSLVKKNTAFNWMLTHQKAFDTLKQKLSSAPGLAVPDYTKPFVIYADASISTIGAVLMQASGQNNLQPLASLSRTLTPAQLNYAVYDKEPLAIITALTAWQHIIRGIPTTVYTDHTPLTSFLKRKDLNNRLARWYMDLIGFGTDLNIQYLKGSYNVVADALSRRPTTLPTPTSTYQLNNIISLDMKDDFREHLRSSYVRDPITQAFLQGDVLPGQSKLFMDDSQLIYTTHQDPI